MIPITAVIPTINEQDTIGELVEMLFEAGCDVVVVDGGSTDATMAIANACAAEVSVCYRGLGMSYRTAWKNIPWTHSVVHVDAGASVPFEDIRKVVRRAREGRWDVVIGSRFADGGSHEAGWKHRTLSRTAAAVSNVLSNKPVRDWTSGLRGYSAAARKVISEHEFVCDGHAWQIEALDVCLRKGLTVKETPITYRSSSSQRTLGRTLEAAKAWRGMVWS